MVFLLLAMVGDFLLSGYTYIQKTRWSQFAQERVEDKREKKKRKEKRRGEEKSREREGEGRRRRREKRKEGTEGKQTPPENC